MVVRGEFEVESAVLYRRQDLRLAIRQGLLAQLRYVAIGRSVHKTQQALCPDVGLRAGTVLRAQVDRGPSWEPLVFKDIVKLVRVVGLKEQVVPIQPESSCGRADAPSHG